jgi:hypothetical protein
MLALNSSSLHNRVSAAIAGEAVGTAGVSAGAAGVPNAGLLNGLAGAGETPSGVHATIRHKANTIPAARSGELGTGAR